MTRGYEPNFEPGSIVPLGTPIFLKRVMIEEDLGLPIPDDPQSALLRRIVREEVERALKQPEPEYPINEAIFGRRFRDWPDGI